MITSIRKEAEDITVDSTDMKSVQRDHYEQLGMHKLDSLAEINQLF